MQVALQAVTAETSKESRLRLGFDALGNDLKAQALGKLDDGADDRLVTGVFADTGDETAVDLQLLDGKHLEVAERGIAGAEIVDGQLDAQIAQTFENILAAFNRHDHRFGQFQLQALRRQAGLRQNGA